MGSIPRQLTNGTHLPQLGTQIFAVGIEVGSPSDSKVQHQMGRKNLHVLHGATVTWILT